MKNSRKQQKYLKKLVITIRQLQNKKCLGEEETITNILEIAGGEIWEAIKAIYLIGVSSATVNTVTKAKGEVIVPFKNGDLTDCENHRSIIPILHPKRSLLRS